MLRLILLISAALLAGCMAGPDYVRPDVDSPAAWRGGEPPQKDESPLVDTRWWEQFGDPVLNGLISDSLKLSKDLLLASARVEEFAARYGTSRAELYPQIGAGAQYERKETNLIPGHRMTTDSYSATLNASWEIDIWGRIRRGGEAARAQLIASEEGRQAVVLSLVSSVAAGYVNLLDLDRQLTVARETVESRRKTLEMFEQRYRFGVISDMELTQTKVLYEDSLASIPQLEKAVAQQENGLNLLLGRNPGDVPRGSSIDRLALPAIPSGLPSGLLTRRPDIRQAEQNLIAANAQIGVARAAYYPAISLTGILGSTSSELSDLFTGPARVWNFTAPLTAPIFTAGRISGNIKATEAVRDQALISYQKTIQSAFREVEDALTDHTMTKQQLSVRSKQLEDLAKYLKLSTLRYDGGYSSYLEVLDAERNFFSAQLSYVQNQGALFQTLINLYKVMGGGWVQEAYLLSGKKN